MLTSSIPFFFGYLGLLQARAKICVALALLDRDLSQGKLQPVGDRESAWRIKKRSLAILLQSGSLSLLSTALLLFA